MPKKLRTKVGEFKTIYKGPFWEIQNADAILPSGKKTIFERAIRSPGVTILPVDKKGRLLLTREYRPIHKSYAWRVPGGRIEKDETPLQAARRELAEEAKLKAGKMELLYKSGAPGILQWDRYVYIATNLSPFELAGDEDEDIKIIPTSFKKVYEMIREEKINELFLVYILMKLLWKKNKK